MNPDKYAGIPAKESPMTGSLLDAAGVDRLVRGAVRAAFAESKSAPMPMVNLARPRRPSLMKAIKAARSGRWTGAELEHDLSEVCGGLFGWHSEGAPSTAALYLATTVKEYAAVLDACNVTTPKSAAIKALASGGNTATISGGGVLSPIESLIGELALPLAAPPILRAMPEVTVIPVTSATIELPRTQVATVQLPGENGTITATDLAPAIGEVKIKKPTLLQAMSDELFADIGDPGAEIVMQRALGASLLSFLDGESLEGDGTGNHVLGIRHQAAATSSWTPATNGSTPGGDDLAEMVHDIFTANAYPSALIMNPRTFFKIARLKDSTGAWLFPALASAFARDGIDYTLPRRVGSAFGASIYVTNNVPVTDIQGTSNAATHVLYGDGSRVFILARQGVELFVSPDSGLGTGQTLIRATVREAVALSQPGSWAVATGII